MWSSRDRLTRESRRMMRACWSSLERPLMCRYRAWSLGLRIWTSELGCVRPTSGCRRPCSRQRRPSACSRDPTSRRLADCATARSSRCSARPACAGANSPRSRSATSIPSAGSCASASARARRTGWSRSANAPSAGSNAISGKHARISSPSRTRARSFSTAGVRRCGRTASRRWRAPTSRTRSARRAPVTSSATPPPRSCTRPAPDIRIIQELLGHEDLSSTQLYTRVSIQRLKEVHTRTHPAANRPWRVEDILAQMDPGRPLQSN